MNAITKDMKDLIVAGTDFVAGTDLFVGRTPTSPGNVLTLLPAPDRGPMLMYDQNDPRYEYGAFQARMRHSEYDEAEAACTALSVLLHNKGNFELNGTWYSLIEALDNPFLLDWDENNRARFVVNFHVQRSEI